MGYSLMKELEFANYNTESNTTIQESKKQGWCYDFCLKFINNHELTKEQLEEAYINSPALETFLVVTPEMKKSKIKLEETLNAKIETMNYERGMAK